MTTKPVTCPSCDQPTRTVINPTFVAVTAGARPNEAKRNVPFIDEHQRCDRCDTSFHTQAQLFLQTDRALRAMGM